MKRFFWLAFLLLACGGKAIIDGAGSGGGGGGGQGGMRAVTVTVGDGGASSCDCSEFCATVDCALPVCCLTMTGQCGCVADVSECAQCL